MQSAYPIFVNISGRPVVVVGGGAVAERKILTLLRYGAKVTVVAPQATERVRGLAEAGELAWVPREYRDGDLEGFDLAFCAVDSAGVGAAVHDEARRRNCLLNVADVPRECDFILPSIVQRGLLSIAVSTNGASCTEAVRIRKRLEGEYDESWGPYLDLLLDFRQLVKERVPGEESARKPIFEAAASADFRRRLAAGEVITAEDAYAEATAMARAQEQAREQAGRDAQEGSR